MKSFLGFAFFLSATALNAQVENRITTTNAAFEIQTMNESCYGDANASVYAQSANRNWHLDIYRNGALLTSCVVANRDTVIHELAMGCYSFIYNPGDATSETISTIISGPSKIISLCRVHYLNRPNENAVSFINLSSGAVTFDWDFGDGEDHSAAISPEHVYALPGTYTVTLTAKNVNSCTSVSTYVVNIPADRSVGNNDPVQSSPGILVESHDGNAHIENTSSNMIAQITVYSVTGQMIYSGSGNDNQFAYATPGIYTAHIVYADGEQESKNVPLN